MKPALGWALVLGAALAAAAAVAAPRPQVDLQCEAFGMGPQLECTVRLRASGAPLVGAQVTLGASMPSMPMAHTVKPAAAAPPGQPGEYRGRLELQMTGVWAVQVDVAGPLRDRVVRPLRIDDCEGDRRCPVPAHNPAATPAATPAASPTASPAPTPAATPAPRKP